MNGGTASEAQRWDEGAKRPKGLKGQACLLSCARLYRQAAVQGVRGGQEGKDQRGPVRAAVGLRRNDEGPGRRLSDDC